MLFLVGSKNDVLTPTSTGEILTVLEISFTWRFVPVKANKILIN